MSDGDTSKPPAASAGVSLSGNSVNGTAFVLGVNPQHFAGGLTVQWWSRAASVPAGGAAPR